MTAEPATEQVGEQGQATTRHPIRVDIDGDFALDDLLALPDIEPARRLSAAQANQTSLWRLDAPHVAELLASSPPDTAVGPDTPTGDDAVLLHRIETSGLFRAPVSDQLAALTPELATAWLALAAHWVDLSRSCRDLRFLNTACKLTGAVWLRHRATGDIRGVGTTREPGMTGQLAALGCLLHEATEHLRCRLANRTPLAAPIAFDDAALRPVRLDRQVKARIAVVTRCGSHSAGRLVTAATTAGLPIETVCQYAPRHSGSTLSSNYSSAWYPPSDVPDLVGALTMPDSVPVATARSWDQVEAAIRAADADLVLLVGMPVVPAHVLDAARLGVLNAHNGTLPSYRGMDAVGWALLHDQPIVCSLHLARPIVDTGEVVATRPVPVAPTRTLAARVKTAQLRLLLAGAAHVATTGTLPDLTPQSTTGTQYYRLHPHLKRLLDASPYAHDDHHQRTVIQP